MVTRLEPRTGVTHAGLPVSLNRAPGAGLTDQVSRLFITIIDQPEDQVIEDFLLNEIAFVRVLVRGAWEAEIVPGQWRAFDGPLMFGAQARPLRVRVRGPMAVAGFAARAAGWPGLFDDSATHYADRILPLGEVWDAADAAAITQAVSAIDDLDHTIAAMEHVLRGMLHRRGHSPADPRIALFAKIARNDPTRKVSDIAESMGLDLFQFGRLVARHFGHGPKIVLRRSRFLDMAATMRGLILPSASQCVDLGYYDQSHRNREFRRFTGMTPARFVATPTPLLTLGIEARQHAKFEDAADLPPGTRAPWLA